jgi:hypothetical protein
MLGPILHQWTLEQLQRRSAREEHTKIVLELRRSPDELQIWHLVTAEWSDHMTSTVCD